MSRLVGAATVLALLYFAREFLIPVTLAFVLSLLIAPAIRRLRRLGLGPSASVLCAVLTFTLVLGALGLAIIRLVGKHDLRATTLAVNDAGARLSRFFVSQALVNLSVGMLVWLGLLVVGVPKALLWGAMAALLRLIPYVGVWTAAFCATLLAAAIVPGWSLAVMTLGLVFAVELMVAQVVEPQLYGHSTGLSPLSVVIAAVQSTVDAMAKATAAAAAA